MLTLLRNSALQLTQSPPVSNNTSAAANLGVKQQFSLALNGPEIPGDSLSFPLAWSLTNCIAVACDADVHYQNLDNSMVSHLCRLARPQGEIHSIEWGGMQWRDTLALGTTTGTVQLWDSSQCKHRKLGTEVHTWADSSKSVDGISWHGNILAVGRKSGNITLFDVRVKDEVKKLKAHKARVSGVKWSHDGTFLASGDTYGRVYIWDARACKSFENQLQKGAKMRHGGAVKVSFMHTYSSFRELTQSGRLWRGVRGNLICLLLEACFRMERSVSGALTILYQMVTIQGDACPKAFTPLCSTRP